MSKEPSVLSAQEDEQALSGVAQALQKQFSTKPEFSKYKDQVHIHVTEEGLRIQLIDKADLVSFPSGSAELTPDAKAILTEIALGICKLPNKIKIGGHTDSRVFPNNNGYTNWELSADRANAARRVLEAGCVSSGQLLRIVGFADTEPLIPEDPYAPANRRISIVVLRLAHTEVSAAQSVEDPKPGSAAIQKVAEAKRSAARPPKPAVTEADETNEKKRAEEKLQTDGAVTVGEPDVVPDRPVLK